MLKRSLVLLSILTLTFLGFAIKVQAETEREANTYFEKGNVHFKKGEYNQAIINYKKAIKINPQLAEANYNIGVSYLNKGKDWYNLATKWLKSALELTPDLAVAHYNLGFISLKQGKIKKALTFFEKAKELDPLDSATNKGIQECERLLSEEKKEQMLTRKTAPPDKAKQKTDLPVPDRPQTGLPVPDRPQTGLPVPDRPQTGKKVAKRVEKKPKVSIKKRPVEVDKLKSKVLPDKLVVAPFRVRVHAVMCKDVEMRKPVEVTKTFSSTDEKVCLFLDLRGVQGEHNLEIKWFNPKGGLYPTFSYPFNSRGSKYRFWAEIDIKGRPAANLKGMWKVRANLDGEELGSYRFTIK